MLSDSRSIAERIKNIARQRNISLMKMYEDCGVSKNALTSMNNGSMPSVATIAKFAEYLDISIDYLLFDKKEARIAQGNPTFYDHNGSIVNMSEENIEIERLRTNQALTLRIEEISRRIAIEEIQNHNIK